MFLDKKMLKNQKGFSLIEILVGLVIGLLATLVIMQIFATFEGQKRSTTGNADAQTNGSIVLFTMQRDLLMAGFGISAYDTLNNPFKCNPTVNVDHDGNAATPNIDMFPIQIIDGGATGSDQVIVRYSTDGATSLGGNAVKVVGLGPASNQVFVDNNLGCNNGDVVLLSTLTTCSMTRVTSLPDTQHINLQSVSGAAIGSSVSCMGKWDQFTYTLVNNQLQRNDANNLPAVTTPLVSDIVNMQAQYGVSATAKNNQITQWVSASGGTWATPSVANRNRIKAIHIAVVARNGLQEKLAVTATCTTAKGTVNNGPCAWDDAGLDAAPVIDLSSDPNWQKYRYRVYDAIIPLRNMVWSKARL